MPEIKLSKGLVELAHAMHTIHEAFAKGYELPPLDDETRKRFFEGNDADDFGQKDDGDSGEVAAGDISPAPSDPERAPSDAPDE